MTMLTDNQKLSKFIFMGEFLALPWGDDFKILNDKITQVFTVFMQSCESLWKWKPWQKWDFIIQGCEVLNTTITCLTKVYYDYAYCYHKRADMHCL